MGLRVVPQDLLRLPLLLLAAHTHYAGLGEYACLCLHLVDHSSFICFFCRCWFVQHLCSAGIQPVCNDLFEARPNSVWQLLSMLRMCRFKPYMTLVEVQVVFSSFVSFFGSIGPCSEMTRVALVNSLVLTRLSPSQMGMVASFLTLSPTSTPSPTVLF